jgi:endonuclease YncB( thermonuclease family)
VSEGQDVKPRMPRRRWPWIVPVMALGLILLVVADQAGALLVRRTDDPPAYHGASAVVRRVISADLLEVDLPDALSKRPVTRVRLWGVRAPSSDEEPWANQARAATSELVAGMIVLRLESHRTRDPFGAVLAHIEIPSGGTLNEALLLAGLAVVDDRRPHTMLRTYAQAQNAARAQGRGVWSR